MSPRPIAGHSSPFSFSASLVSRWWRWPSGLSGGGPVHKHRCAIMRCGCARSIPPSRLKSVWVRAVKLHDQAQPRHSNLRPQGPPQGSDFQTSPRSSCAAPSPCGRGLTRGGKLFLRLDGVVRVGVEAVLGGRRCEGPRLSLLRRNSCCEVDLAPMRGRVRVRWSRRAYLEG